MAGLALLAGCGSPGGRGVTLDALAAAPPRPVAPVCRGVVADAAALRPLVQPLAHRLGLIQVRTGRQWRQLQRAVRISGPCPDLHRGTLVGLAAQTGTPLDGVWPLTWRQVRVYGGAGLIEARFHPGEYLADDVTYVQAAYVEGLAAVLVVDVDGVQYFPP